MIQLTYQPAFDPFHAVFRIIRLQPIIKKPSVVLQQVVRILDFYLLFPFLIDEIRLAPKHRKYKKLAAQYDGLKPYGGQPDSRTLFDRMEPMQIAAQETLATRNILEPKLFSEGKVQLLLEAVPKELAARAARANEADRGLLDFLGVLASEYDLMGENGVKARSGLMEFRYDAI